MSEQDDGGSTLPHESFDYYEESLRALKIDISLRDWFAGQALAGIYANRELQMSVILYAKAIEGFEPKMANAAYLAADAMLAERAKKGGS